MSAARAVVLALVPGLVPAVAAAQLSIGVAGGTEYVEHRVKAGGGVEIRSGPLFGGAVHFGFGTAVELGAAAASGTLEADSANTADADLARGEIHVLVRPVEMVAIRAGLGLHAFSDAAAVQRWTTLRLGGEARLPFVGGGVTALLRFELFPYVGVSGQERPSRAVSGGAGLLFRAGPLTGELVYAIERYDFPDLGTLERREQLGILTLRAGLQLGGRTARP